MLIIVTEMNFHSLRHRRKKAAKPLAIFKQFASDVICRVDKNTGDDGYSISDPIDKATPDRKIMPIRCALENKRYRFTEKKSPWLWQITYTGRAEGKSTIIITIPVSKDRMNINADEPEVPFSFTTS